MDYDTVISCAPFCVLEKGRCGKENGMSQKDFKTRIAYEALIILGVLALLSLICRLWPILLLIILGIFVAALRLLFLSVKQAPETPTAEPEKETPSEPTEQDLQNMAYSLILSRISALVTDEYPDARWVWAQPNAKRMILEDEDVYILLNHAGGYAKARVIIHNLKVCGLEYQTAGRSEKETKSESGEETRNPSESESQNDLPENFELIAFQWVEAHTLELNNRCNDAIGQGEEMLILGADELPAPESWADICVELKRVGIAEAECTEVGVKINLTQ